MTRARLRALVAAAFAASLVLLLVLPAGVLGGKATRASDHSIEVFCDGLVGDDGTLFLSASLSDTFGVFAGLEAFPPGAEPFVDPASFRSSDEPATGSYVGGALELDIPVVDGAGDPAGSAVIEAALVSAGEPEPISDRFREGNQWFRTTGTLFPLSVAEGSATLPDGSTFDLAGGQCFSAEFDVTSFSTNPTADIERFTANNMNCALIDGDGTQVGNLFADVDSDQTFAFVDAFFFDPPFGATADVDIVGGNISTSLEFIDGETGEPVGVGELNLTLSQAGERFSYVLRGGTASDRVHGEAYDVEGTLTAPGFEPFDLGDCVLADRTIKQIQSPARQPQPTGRAPGQRRAVRRPPGPIWIQPEPADEECRHRAGGAVPLLHDRDRGGPGRAAGPQDGLVQAGRHGIVGEVRHGRLRVRHGPGGLRAVAGWLACRCGGRLQR